jgi:hypothetical protein
MAMLRFGMAWSSCLTGWRLDARGAGVAAAGVVDSGQRSNDVFAAFGQRQRLIRRQ